MRYNSIHEKSAADLLMFYNNDLPRSPEILGLGIDTEIYSIVSLRTCRSDSSRRLASRCGIQEYSFWIPVPPSESRTSFTAMTNRKKCIPRSRASRNSPIKPLIYKGEKKLFSVKKDVYHETIVRQ